MLKKINIQIKKLLDLGIQLEGGEKQFTGVRQHIKLISFCSTVNYKNNFV